MRNVLSRVTVAIVVAVLLAVWISAASHGPARALASGMTSPFFRFWHGFSSRASLAGKELLGHGPDERLRDLEEQARRLQVAAGEVAMIQQQNRDLRAFYGLPKRAGWRSVVAEVTARDPVTWNRGFRINRGSSDGVVAGAVVLAGEYVVGRIAEVQVGSASVTMIGSRGCRLSARLEGSSATGILEGLAASGWRRRPQCQVDFLPKDITVTAGEFVWTSGLGEAIPVGLVVGRVVPVPEHGDMTLEIVEGAHGRVRIEPMADFDKITFVAVFCPDPSAPLSH